METLRLLVFTTLWTAIWAAPLPKLSRRVELIAGLIPFAAFGLRVFGALADDRWKEGPGWPARRATAGMEKRRRAS